jgi:glutathione synthase
MELLFLVDDVPRHRPETATVWLARALHARGHGVRFAGTGDLGLDEGDRVIALARRAPDQRFRAPGRFLEAVQGAPRAPVTLAEVDGVLIRCNPGKGAVASWSYTALLSFCRMAVEQGARVLNSPEGLSRALDKLYLHAFPPDTRPRGIVSRDKETLRAFVDRLEGPAVLKPLTGSGGSGVFLVGRGERANLGAIIETLAQRGYVIAQEYQPAAVEGDVRLILLEGRPLAVRGRYAAVRRRPSGGDLRSNIAAGGSSAPAEATEAMLALAEKVRPRLQADGAFLAGLDIIGDRLVEVNVFSPGGLPDASQYAGVDFSVPIAEALERRLVGDPAAG